MSAVDVAPAAEIPRGRRRRAERTGQPLGLASGIGLGTAVLWLSLLVLIPLGATASQAFDNGWDGFWHAVTQPAALQSLRLTVLSSLIVTAINAVMGTLIAWVLVRDQFPGKRVIEFVIDIPFA